jgi:hypothetical protein
VAEMHNGDFSQWRNASGQLTIYDPATTRPNLNGPVNDVPQQPDPGRALQPHQSR